MNGPAPAPKGRRGQERRRLPARPPGPRSRGEERSSPGSRVRPGPEGRSLQRRRAAAGQERPGRCERERQAQESGRPVHARGLHQKGRGRAPAEGERSKEYPGADMVLQQPEGYGREGGEAHERESEARQKLRARMKRRGSQGHQHGEDRENARQRFSKNGMRKSERHRRRDGGQTGRAPQRGPEDRKRREGRLERTGKGRVEGEHRGKPGGEKSPAPR